MIAGIVCFGIFALLALLGAKRPDRFVRFLPDWQREQIGEEDLPFVSSTFWLMCALFTFTTIALIIDYAFGR